MESPRRSSLTLELIWSTRPAVLYVNVSTSSTIARPSIPSRNEQAERINQLLDVYLHTYSNYTQGDWDLHCPVAELCYNNSKHEVTGITPFFATYEYHPSFNFAAETPGHLLSDATASLHAEYMTDLHLISKAKLEARRLAVSHYHNRRRLEHTFDIDQMVSLKIKNIRTWAEVPQAGPKEDGSVQDY